MFCLRNGDQISVASKHVRLTYPPGLALNAQLLCPDLDQVPGAKDLFRGHPFPADLPTDLQTQLEPWFQTAAHRSPSRGGQVTHRGVRTPKVSETQHSDSPCQQPG